MECKDPVHRTRHRTRDYFAFQWPLIDFCAYETGVNSELAFSKWIVLVSMAHRKMLNSS